jgi:hypothetical protein
MMLADLIDRLLMLVGFRTITRSASAEFGPPPGARHTRQLAAYSDLDLVARERDDILRAIRAKETDMGPYCKFCDQRCFVPRILRDGRHVLLATCAHGMEHDRAQVGEDYTTAINPRKQVSTR